MQYKFIYNIDSNRQVGEWTTPENSQDVNGDGSAFVFNEEISAGNFDPGTHAVKLERLILQVMR